jgi:orotidine-5'-phosphate decarboxylase
VAEYWPFSLSRQGLLKERLIVELDHGPRHEALAMVEHLASSVGMFKVGKHLFMNSGPDLIRDIRRRGGEVFLDLKFHDAPRCVSRAAIEATRLGVKMFDLHPGYSTAGYGTAMMERTRQEVNKLCQCEGLRRPYIVAITMLTSLGAGGRACRPESLSAGDQIAALARLAADASLDGVVTSPSQVSRVRAVCGRRVMIVTFAVSTEDGWHEQPACIGPAQAVRSGADYLVVGKPVWKAADPLRMVRELLREMDRGVRSAQRGSLALFSERPSIN